MKTLVTALALMMTITLSAQTSEKDYDLGHTLMKDRKYKEALVHLEKFEKESEKKKRVYEKLANCYYKLDQFDAFLEACENGLEYNKKDKTRYYMLLGIYYNEKAGDSQKAIENFNLVRVTAEKELAMESSEQKRYKLQRRISFAQSQISKMQ
jgi:tetratricopeptide (TPR) repeat protein